jgi:hypothetical protein
MYEDPLKVATSFVAYVVPLFHASWNTIPTAPVEPVGPVRPASPVGPVGP